MIASGEIGTGKAPFAALARTIRADGGHIVRHPSGATMSIKVFAAETGGEYSLMETILPSGGVIPLHVHAHEDENTFVIEGKLTMQIGEEVFQVEAGDYVVAPRGVDQTFKNEGVGTCRFLTTFTPGGAEGFFKEVGEILADRPGRLDPEVNKALQAKYGFTYF